MKVHPPLLWPCILALALAHASLAAHQPRQGGLPVGNPRPAASGTDAPSNTPTNVTPPTQPTQTQQTQTPTAAIPTLTLTNTQPTQTGITTGTTTPAGTSNAATTTPPTTPGQTPNTSAPPDAQPSDSVTVTVINSSQTSTVAPTSTGSSNEDNDSGGLSTGSIIGMSVAAGVAVIGIIGFFVWKLTRKRFSDFDDNEAIKWPELNTHNGGGPDSHALPARDTGRSGFDTGSEADLTRINSTSNYSTPDLGVGGPDPYAVPPLPHLNPNQPYRDDPTAPSGYYDPYRGPVPGTLDHGTGDWQPEAYPMTQFGGPQGRSSPAPEYLRGSPAPQAAYSGRASPGPQAAYGGRASPNPHAAYPTGRASPGPNAAYGAR